MDLAAAAAHHRQRVRNTYFQKNSKNDGRPSHPLALIELDFVRNAQAGTKKCSPTKHVLVMMWKHSFVVMPRVVEVFKMTIVLDNNDVKMLN